MRNTIFFLLVLFTLNMLFMLNNAANAYYVLKAPDGRVKTIGCKEKTIGKDHYICCDDNCQKPEYWIERAYEGEINYMKDLAEVETIDRHTMSDEKVEFEKVEDNKTPALGKLQNKLDDIGSSIFGLIGF